MNCLRFLKNVALALALHTQCYKIIMPQSG
jgi:hypothetical protein